MSDKKGMIKDASILLLITVVAGLILGFVYQITKEPIAAAEEKAAKAAYQEVFPDAAGFSDKLELAVPEGDSTWEQNYHGDPERWYIKWDLPSEHFRNSRTWHEGRYRTGSPVCRKAGIAVYLYENRIYDGQSDRCHQRCNDHNECSDNGRECRSLHF